MARTLPHCPALQGAAGKGPAVAILAPPAPPPGLPAWLCTDCRRTASLPADQRPELCTHAKPPMTWCPGALGRNRSLTKSREVPQSRSKSHKVAQSATECHRVAQSPRNVANHVRDLVQTGSGPDARRRNQTRTGNRTEKSRGNPDIAARKYHQPGNRTGHKCTEFQASHVPQPLSAAYAPAAPRTCPE